MNIAPVFVHDTAENLPETRMACSPVKYPDRGHARPRSSPAVLAGLVLAILVFASGCRTQGGAISQYAGSIDSLGATLSTTQARQALMVSELESIRAEQSQLRREMRDLVAELDSTRYLLHETLAENARTLSGALTQLSDSLRHAYVLQFQRGLELNRMLRGRTLDVVYFQPGSTQLTSAATQRLDQIAAQIRQLAPGRRVLVEGHADDTAFTAAQSQQNNRVLSAERAATVVRYFVEHSGLNGGQFDAAGYGTDLPLVPNEAAEGRQINRRVRIAVLDPQ
jgi:flagellar motor protein MotB